MSGDFISRDTLLARLKGLELNDDTGDPVDVGYSACLEDVRALITSSQPGETTRPGGETSQSRSAHTRGEAGAGHSGSSHGSGVCEKCGGSHSANNPLVHPESRP